MRSRDACIASVNLKALRLATIVAEDLWRGMRVAQRMAQRLPGA
jgi:hypothetical protein